MELLGRMDVYWMWNSNIGMVGWDGRLDLFGCGNGG